MRDVSEQPSVLIVLLNWNSADDTIMAVNSVLAMNYENAEVVIIDNGSADGSVMELRRIVNERVSLIELPENRGYTGGCNVGLQRGVDTGARYVWLLNNDAVVPANTLASLVKVAEADRQVGLVTPLIASLGEAPYLTFAGGVIDTNAMYYNQTSNIDEARRWRIEYPGKELGLGTALLVPTRVVGQIGLLDDRFFAYFEDTDYSARSLAAGYQNVVDQTSMVQHFSKNHEASPREIKPHYWYYMARNESRFWRKHVGLLRSLKPTAGSFLRFLVSYNACEGLPDSQEALLAGFWDGWLNRGGPFRREARMPRPIALLVRRFARQRRFRYVPRIVTRPVVRILN